MKTCLPQASLRSYNIVTELKRIANTFFTDANKKLDHEEKFSTAYSECSDHTTGLCTERRYGS
jgi:hypothetical protein